jgi:signal transduction histidine kinase
MLISAEKVELTGKVYMLIMGIEITERKRAVAELLFQNIIMSTQQEVSNDGILVVDDKSRIQTCNRKFINMWGLPRELLKSGTDEPVLEYVTSQVANPDGFRQHVKHLYENRQETSHDELVLKDGRIFERFTSSMNGPGGQYYGRVWYFSDITGRRQAEEEIHTLNTELESRVVERTQQLQTANLELEAFSYSVSHDLRAPLRGITGFAQILSEDYSPMLDDEGKKICSFIEENAHKMEHLIDDLLAFSQLSRTELRHTHIRMKLLVNTLFYEMTDPLARERIQLNISNISDAQGDMNMIRQVWVNLMSNALKYSSKKEQSVISISCRKSNGYAIYCIKDNGVGFNMKYSHKLFGVFQRLHSAKEFDGIGVGLAIVQRIVLRHGGDAWAESEVDKGAAFYFSLPAK